MDRIEKYRQYREVQRRLHDDIIKKSVSKKKIIAAGKALKLWKSGAFVLDSVNDSDVLMDFALHETYPGMASVLSLYRKEVKPSTELEARMLEALAASYSSLFVVSSVHLSESCIVFEDLLNRDSIVELTDVNMSQTAVAGSLLFFRVVNCDEITMTSGVSFPFLAANREFLLQRDRKIAATKDAALRGRKRFILFYDLSRQIGLKYSYK